MRMTKKAKEEFLTALANAYIAQEIAHDFEVTSDWQEIKSTTPMRIEKRWQRISLEIECQHNTDQDEFISELADGTIINPEVQIIDEFGNVYELEGGHATGQPHAENIDIFVARSIGFSARSNWLPDDRVYVKIRIRNSESFICPKIVWLNYEMFK